MQRVKSDEKILLIAAEFPPGPGGIGSHAYSLAKALRGGELPVVVFAAKDYCKDEAAATFDKMQSFEIHRFRKEGWRTYPLRLVDTSRHVRKNPIKTVLLSGKFALWIGLWLRLRFFYRKMTIIGILHGSEVNPSARWERTITHWAMRCCDRLVAVSRYTASLVPRWIAARRRITVIPNGIDWEQMEKESGHPCTVRLEGNPVLLTVGGVTPRKGQQRVIRAMPEILKRYPEACYHIVGLPVYKEQFVRIAEEAGVSDRVVFHGLCETREKLSEYYRAADIFMLLSENQKSGDVEGFGIVVLEAGFFSLPVIGAKGCGIADAIGDGVNGYLVDGDDAAEVREAIAKILSDRKGFGERARGWAERYDWNRVVEMFFGLLTNDRDKND